MDGFSKFKNWQTVKNQSITIDFNNTYQTLHALKLKEILGKLAISHKLEEISKCCQKDFLTSSRTVYERVKLRIWPKDKQKYCQDIFLATDV